MIPVLFQWGPVTVYSFGVMLALAVVICSLLLSRDAAQAGIPKETVFDLVFWTILGGILGARIFFIVLNLSDFVGDPAKIFMLSGGGLAWQGGLILGGAAGVAYVKIKKLSLRLMADLCAPYLALGQAIGRLGCFLNGCCYGRPWDGGIYFPAHGAHLHPTQLYESVFLLGLFFILRSLRISLGAGRCAIFAFYLIAAGLGRFINEFFRADHVLTPVGLSIFQIVSLGVILAGVLLLNRSRVMKDQ